MNCTIDEQHPNVIHVTSELFKRDDAFAFDAYVEGSDDARLESSRITINHRLTNTAEIYARKISVVRMRERKKHLWLAGLYFAMCVVLTCAMICAFFYDRPIRYVDKQQNEKVFSAVLISNDSVAILDGKNGVLPWNREHISVEEFIQKYDIYTDFHEMTTWDTVLMIGIIEFMNLIVLIMLILLIMVYRRQMRVIEAYEKINVNERNSVTNKEDVYLAGK